MVIEMPERKVPQRALVATFCLALMGVIALALLGSGSAAIGLAIGSAIGWTSLASFTYAVPRLLRPGDPVARAFFGLIAMIKLPVYAVVLNYAMVSPAVMPVAVFIGVALVPLVILALVLVPQPRSEAAAVRPSPGA